MNLHLSVTITTEITQKVQAISIILIPGIKKSMARSTPVGITKPGQRLPIPGTPVPHQALRFCGTPAAGYTPIPCYLTIKWLKMVCNTQQ
jgi:hypothetical protein